MKKQKKNTQNGITLIALVITIIVLLILAGVSINAVVGQNGVLNKAQDAVIETKRASIEETIQIEFAGAYDNNGKVDMSVLADGLLARGASAVLESGDGLVATFDGNNYYIDEEGNVIALGSEAEGQNIVAANEPKLSSGMIPIKYNGTKWVICSSDDPDWYSYTKSKKQWANVMLSDGKYDSTATVGTEVEYDELGSTFVWIPRYAYKITDGYKAQKGSLDIVWLDGDTNSYTYIENGSLKEGTATTSPVLNTTSTAYTDYVVHPCFQNGSTSGYKNGEWSKEISGIWVSKFEGAYPMSENTNDNKVATTFTVDGEDLYYPVFKGQRYSYNYLTISQIYSMLLNIDGTSNPYGLTETADSHFIKNSEWGAVTYLSYSAYGIGNNTEAKEISLNNVNLNGKINSIASKAVYAVTGYAGEHEASQSNSMATNTFSTAPTELAEELSNGTQTSYAWYTSKGVQASTTGNIYGIYDIAGGQNEMTASYVDYDKSKATYLTTYGSSFTSLGNTKYATAYKAYSEATNYGTNESFREWTLANGYFGDGLFEVSTVNDLTTSGYYAWFGDYQEADNTHEPFFLRGGNCSYTTTAGLFNLADANGNCYYSGRGFRAVLVGE